MAGSASWTIGGLLLLIAPNAHTALTGDTPPPLSPNFPIFETDSDGGYFQFRIDQGIVIRVPSARPTSNLQSVPRNNVVRWKEDKGPKCQSLSSFATAVGADDNGLDIQLRDGTFIRAKFDDDCPTDQFYSGFYVERPVDGQLCAGRDTLHSRSGIKCKIESFKSLRAKQ